MKKRKLFIGNLDYSVTAEKIKRFLAPHGMVINVKVMEGKGYAFVEMGTEEQAQKIQRTLSETVFEGRKLLIDGVPGTRRHDRKPDRSSPESRDRRSIGALGKKPGLGYHGDGKKVPKPELKTREPGDRLERPPRDQRPAYKTEKPPQKSQGQKSPKSVSQIDKVYPKPKPAYQAPVGTPVNRDKAVKNEAGKKPESPPKHKPKKSRVPVWVKEKRSSGNIPKKVKY